MDKISFCTVFYPNFSVFFSEFFQHFTRIFLYFTIFFRIFRTGKITESNVPTNVAFMSPERVSGGSYNPFASDIYSFGMVIFMATSGMNIFQSSDPGDIKSVR